MKIRAEHSAAGPMIVGDLIEQLQKIPDNAEITAIVASDEEWSFVAYWEPTPPRRPPLQGLAGATHRGGFAGSTGGPLDAGGAPASGMILSVTPSDRVSEDIAEQVRRDRRLAATRRAGR